MFAKKTGIDQDAFEYLEELGSGSFGKVHKVVHRESGEICAMKLLSRDRAEKNKLMKYVLAERNTMCKVDHPFVVGLRYAFQTDKQFVIVMQYCPGGDLQALIRQEKRLPVPLAKFYAAEVLLALEHLHDNGVLHRDMKPENVLLDCDDHALLTDFGLAKETDNNHGMSFCGSVAYIAPEMLHKTGHKHTVDIYGLGVLIYYMLVGQIPFFNQDKHAMWKAVKNDEVVLPKRLPAEASSLIKQLMRKEPHERLGATKTEHIEKHAFFKGMDFAALLDKDIPVPKATSAAKSYVSCKSSFYTVAQNDSMLERSKSQKADLFGPDRRWSRCFDCVFAPRIAGFDYHKAPEEVAKPARKTDTFQSNRPRGDSSVRRDSSVPRRQSSTASGFQRAASSRSLSQSHRLQGRMSAPGGLDKPSTFDGRASTFDRGTASGGTGTFDRGAATFDHGAVRRESSGLSHVDLFKEALKGLGLATRKSTR